MRPYPISNPQNSAYKEQFLGQVFIVVVWRWNTLKVACYLELPPHPTHIGWEGEFLVTCMQMEATTRNATSASNYKLVMEMNGGKIHHLLV
jgi:hypothetical protein